MQTSGRVQAKHGRQAGDGEEEQERNYWPRSATWIRRPRGHITKMTELYKDKAGGVGEGQWKPIPWGGVKSSGRSHRY